MYNNYGFNPYYQPQRFNTMPQQPSMEQPIQQPIQNNIIQNRSILNGKQVDSIDVVKTIEYPLDGSTSYFPITDGSAIVTKQMQMDGKSKIVVYKPVIEENKETNYITHEDMQKAFKTFKSDVYEDFKEELQELKSEMKDLKKTKKKEDKGNE